MEPRQATEFRNGLYQQAKSKVHPEINAELLRQYTEIQNVFKEFEVQRDAIPTPAQIKERSTLKTKRGKENHEGKAKG